MRRLARKEIPEGVAKVVQRASTIIAETVIDGTPVDTTLHVSNWRASVGTPATGEVPALIPGRSGSSASASRALAKSSARRIIRSYRGGSVVHITNNAPVIESLNNGAASRQGGHFVENALNRVNIYVRNTDLDLPEA